MRRAALLVALAVVLSAIGCGGGGSTTGASGSANAASKATQTASKTTATGGRCQGLPGRDRPGVVWHGNPRKALPPEGGSLAPATHVALRWRGSPSASSNRGERVVEAAFAPEAHFYRTFIRRTLGCPPRVYRRTIFAAVQYPHAGSASLFVSKLFIARFPGDRYRVWAFFHS